MLLHLNLQEQIKTNSSNKPNESTNNSVSGVKIERNPKMIPVGLLPIRSEMAGTNIPKIANPAPNAAITRLIELVGNCL